MGSLQRHVCSHTPASPTKLAARGHRLLTTSRTRLESSLKSRAEERRCSELNRTIDCTVHCCFSYPSLNLFSTSLSRPSGMSWLTSKLCGRTPTLPRPHLLPAPLRPLTTLALLAQIPQKNPPPSLETASGPNFLLDSSSPAARGQLPQQSGIYNRCTANCVDRVSFRR